MAIETISDPDRLPAGAPAGRQAEDHPGLSAEDHPRDPAGSPGGIAGDSGSCRRTLQTACRQAINHNLVIDADLQHSDASDILILSFPVPKSRLLIFSSKNMSSFLSWKVKVENFVLLNLSFLNIDLDL